MKYECRCGSILKSSTKSSITKHEKTKKHIKFISETSSKTSSRVEINYSNVYKYKNYIEEDKLHPVMFSKNPHPYTIHILETNPDKINWAILSGNPNAINLLKTNLDKIDWWVLSHNANAIHLLESNPDKIDWNSLCSNPNAIHILEDNLDKINWGVLSRNPNAIHLLEANPDKINWNSLCSNPNAIHLLEANPDKINWGVLSRNPNAIHIIENNLDKIVWYDISSNPNIFTYDYEKMKSNCNIFKEELIQYIYHPSRIFKNVNEDTDIDEILDMYD